MRSTALRTKSSRALRNSAVFVATAVGFALVLSGCFGGDDSEEPTTDTPTTVAAAAAPAPPATPEPTAAPAAPAPPSNDPVVLEPLDVAPIPDPPIPPELPSVPEPPPAPTLPRDSGPLIYTVEEGDTLSSIVRKFADYGLTLEELIETNNIENPDVIYLGQELVIPPPN